MGLQDRTDLEWITLGELRDLILRESPLAPNANSHSWHLRSPDVRDNQPERQIGLPARAMYSVLRKPDVLIEQEDMHERADRALWLFAISKTWIGMGRRHPSEGFEVIPPTLWPELEFDTEARTATHELGFQYSDIRCLVLGVLRDELRFEVLGQLDQELASDGGGRISLTEAAKAREAASQFGLSAERIFDTFVAAASRGEFSTLWVCVDGKRHLPVTGVQLERIRRESKPDVFRAAFLETLCVEQVELDRWFQGWRDGAVITVKSEPDAMSVDPMPVDEPAVNGTSTDCAGRPPKVTAAKLLEWMRVTVNRTEKEATWFKKAKEHFLEYWVTSTAWREAWGQLDERFKLRPGEPPESDPK